MSKLLMIMVVLTLILAFTFNFASLEPYAYAHKSGCHRWHSCPSDTGSYVCGDLGYSSGCPNNKSGEYSQNQTSSSIPEQEVSSTKNTDKGGGCLIATAAFGSELAPQVQMLREIRDGKLLHTQAGTAFMIAFNKFYYTFSPTVAEWERQNLIFKEAVKIIITPLIYTLIILSYLDVNSETEVLAYGIAIIGLNIGIYFVGPALTINKLRSKLSHKNFKKEF